jgi:pimeloyl-ACP methyl ester carboxylesterase
MAAGAFRRNGVYSGWSHAGNHRLYVRVPTATKQGRVNGNGNGAAPEEDLAPIVLVHGFGSSRLLKPLLRALGEHRPVFAPDLPGFGMSDPPVRPLEVSELADELRRWMIDSDISPAVVTGTSFGCQVAVDLAARHPAIVDRLVLVAPMGDPELRRTPGQLAVRWAKSAHRASPRVAPALVHDVFDASPWRAMRNLRQGLDHKLDGQLEEVEAPALVIRGERDHLVPAEWAKQVARRLPDAELVVLPRTGHTIGPKAAERLAPLLERFLADESTAAEPAKS